jgi:hemolysin-activating ACP:hemolysin acyltransferase
LSEAGGDAPVIAEGAKGSAKPELSADELAKRAAAAKQISATFGECVALLMRSPHYKHYSLTDLEWLLAPPLAMGQCLVAGAQDKTSGISAPIALLLWATVSDDVDRRLTQNVSRPLRLRPDEWKSGDIPWIVAAEGDPRIMHELVTRLREERLKGKDVKAVVVGRDGRRHLERLGRQPGQTS